MERIVAGTADQPVVAAAAAQRVVAVRAIDEVLVGVAGDLVVAVAANDVLDVLDSACREAAEDAGDVDIRLGRPVEREGQRAVVTGEPDRVVADPAVDRVDAGAAVDRVVALASEQGVVPGSAEELIVVIPAIERVLALIAIEQVVALEAGDDVVAGLAEQDIGERGAGDRIGSGKQLLDGGADAMGAEVRDEIAVVDGKSAERPDRHPAKLQQQGGDRAVDRRGTAIGEAGAGNDDRDVAAQGGGEPRRVLLAIGGGVVGEGREVRESCQESDGGVRRCGEVSHG